MYAKRNQDTRDLCMSALKIACLVVKKDMRSYRFKNWCLIQPIEKKELCCTHTKSF